MTDETQSDTDDGEEQNRELVAWLKATLLALVARAKGALAQSIDEIAPQVTGALGRLRVPPGAVKPLALAAVLIVAAVAFPAAPFAGDPVTNTTEEPVEGTTYESVDAGSTGEELRKMVADRIQASTTSAPAPPSQVRTSAGSQTMRVETSVADGDPAIVLEDDRTHEGRWVAIDTSWFKEEVGEVPQMARIEHETDGTYSSPVEVRGDEATFYVEGFSSNTVTFDGVLSVSASPAVDGDTISYDAPNGGDNLSIDLTGVDNTQPASKSASASNGDAIGISVGGTTAPRNETVTFTGLEDRTAWTGSGTGDGTVTVGGNQPAEDISATLEGSTSTSNGDQSWSNIGTGSLSLSNPGNIAPTDGNGGDPALTVTDTAPGSPYTQFVSSGSANYMIGSSSPGHVNSELLFDSPPQKIDEISLRGTGYGGSGTVDVYVNQNGINEAFGEGTLVASRNVDVSSNTLTFDFDQPYDTNGNPVTVEFVSSGFGDDEWFNIDLDTSATSAHFSSNTGAESNYPDATLKPASTNGLTITAGDGSTSVNIGDVSAGSTKTVSFPVSEDAQSLDVSASYLTADVSIDKVDRTATADPALDLDGDGTDEVAHTGILENGQTATIAASGGLSSGSNSIGSSTLAGPLPSWTLDATAVTQTEDPSVSIGGTTVSHTGVLGPGQTVSQSVALSTGSQSADVSVTGPVGVEASWTEVSETTDPVVNYNGNSAGYTGTLTAGETTSLAVNDSWINEGANDLSVSLGSVSSGPQPQVGIDVTHDIQESRTIDYSAEAFSERYEASKTWSENTTNATMRIPWASSSVVTVRDISVTYEDSTGSEPSPRPTPTHRLENGSVVVELGDVQAGWTTTISAAGSKVQADGASLEVVNATAAGGDLDTRIRLNNPSSDVYIRVGGTEQGQQLHYLADASWSNTEASQISADGTNEIRIPNAPDNGEANLRTLPLAFDVETGAIDVDIPDGRLNEKEPVYRVSAAGSTGDDYHVTYVDAADEQPYVLWSETREIVLDSGIASSPLTLSTSDSDETQIIQFREDDGSVTGSGGTGPVGAIGPMVTTSSPFSGLSGLLPGPNVFLIGIAGLAGLAIIGRQTRLFDEGTASDAVADSAASVGERAGDILGRALSNELVLAVLTLGGGVWLLTSGAFTPTERLIISIGTVPVAMFLVLQQFDQFDIRIWAGSTAVIAVLGVQAIAPGVFATIAEEAGIIIVAGGLILGWRALSAWRAEASTPDTVNRLSISTEDDDDK